jgi:hypothetical protein
MSLIGRLPCADRRESLARRIEEARCRTVAWLHAMRAAAPAGAFRISGHHDASRWPGMLLPGTYNAILCAALIGALDELVPDREALVDWLESFRRVDGAFRIPEMRGADVFKKSDCAQTWQYIDFHTTNYSLGAVEMLAPARRPNLGLARSFLDPLILKAWLAERDLRDPWQEGNNIVNLGSFLLLLRRFEPDEGERVDAALKILFDWHDRLQEPATGFWGVGQLSDPARLLHAMAGSMHNYHLWYDRERPLPNQDRAIDYVLTLSPVINSACIDVDAVDLLAHGHRMLEHRKPEIEAWLAQELEALLAFQNDDGGFADVRSGVRRQDGWVRGYQEPQGLSNSFATWFRWIAIAMIADIFWPRRWPWRFRSMIGIGYRKATS